MLQRVFEKKVKMSVLIACMVMVLTACGSSKSLDFDNGAAPMAVAGATSEIGLMNYDYASDEYWEAEVPGAGMEEGAAVKKSEVEIKETNRKLIKTVDMNVETQNYEELLLKIQGQVDNLGGYIENMNTYNGSRYYDYNPIRNADMTIRIPKEKLEEFLDSVSDVSNIVRRSDNVKDVTLEYVDLESHKNALETEHDRLLNLMERAETVEDIITIEQRLSDVRYQLESMESRLRTFDNQVDYSTVYLSIEEVEIYTPAEKETVMEQISKGFKKSIDNICNGFVEFGIRFVINIPYLVLWGVFISLFVGFIVFLIKHSVKKPNEQKTGINSMQEKTNQNQQKK